MEKLPWVIQCDIIDNIASLEPKYCLVNKEWFFHAAGRFMTITSDMLRNDSHLSIWFNKAEKIMINQFSQIKWDLLSSCQNIKNIEFDFKDGDVEIPVCLLTVLNKSSLESARLSLGTKDITEKICFLFEGISLQLKYLSLVFDFNNKITRMFSISFQNLILFKAGYFTDSVTFSDINKSMPKLEILSIHANEINFYQLPREISFFKKLKILDIKVKFRFPFSGESNINDLTQFYFPCLKTFKFQYISEEININRLPQCMPKLQILHLDLMSHKVLSPGFPIFPFSCLRELNLNFYKRVNEALIFNLENLPNLIEIQINDDFGLSDLETDNLSNITKLDLGWSKSFPYQEIRNCLTNLKLLTIDCSNIENNIYDVFKLCDRVVELELKNISDNIVVEYLPLGPFKTTHLKMSGEHFLSDELLDWFSSQFQLNCLNLENGGYSKLHLDITKFPNLHHFYLS